MDTANFIGTFLGAEAAPARPTGEPVSVAEGESHVVEGSTELFAMLLSAATLKEAPSEPNVASMDGTSEVPPELPGASRNAPVEDSTCAIRVERLMSQPNDSRETSKLNVQVSQEIPLPAAAQSKERVAPLVAPPPGVEWIESEPDSTNDTGMTSSASIPKAQHRAEPSRVLQPQPIIELTPDSAAPPTPVAAVPDHTQEADQVHARATQPDIQEDEAARPSGRETDRVSIPHVTVDERFVPADPDQDSPDRLPKRSTHRAAEVTPPPSRSASSQPTSDGMSSETAPNERAKSGSARSAPLEAAPRESTPNPDTFASAREPQVRATPLGGDRIPAPNPSRVATLEWTPEIRSELAAKARDFLERGSTEIRITLDPPSLGRLHIRLEVGEGRVSAHLVASNAQTAALLDRDRADLVRAFEAQGIDEVSVHVGSERDGRGPGANAFREFEGFTREPNFPVEEPVPVLRSAAHRTLVDLIA